VRALRHPVRPVSRLFWVVSTLFAVVFFGGCIPGTTKQAAIAEAYVGAVELQVRDDFSPRAKVVTTLPFGEQVDILGVHRRFVKVRGGNDIEGWVDQRRLINEDQMDRWKKLRKDSKELPSQGSAKVFSPLNVHTEAHRQSPAFYQLQEEDRFEMVGLATSLRDAPYEVPAIDFGLPTRRARVKKSKEESKVSTPNSTAPTTKPDESTKVIVKPVPPPAVVKPAPITGKKGSSSKLPEPPPGPRMEDWAMIRLKDGRVGWVLMNPLFMDIPEDVMQYAEGQRVTSYFELRTVQDDVKGPMRDWVWTTISKAGNQFQFDGVRVFTWNRRLHRYETAFRERDVVGYYPVSTGWVDTKSSRGGGKAPAFTLITLSNGTRVKRTFAYEDGRVRLVDTQSAEPKPDGPIQDLLKMVK
jgi:uncharacterized protein YgiM (DUF1202 family)